MLKRTLLVISCGATPLRTPETFSSSMENLIISARSLTWIQARGCCPLPIRPPKPKKNCQKSVPIRPPRRPRTTPDRIQTFLTPSLSAMAEKTAATWNPAQWINALPIHGGSSQKMALRKSYTDKTIKTFLGSLKIKN